MKHLHYLLLLVILSGLVSPSNAQTKFRAVAFYTTTVERDHVDFARDAVTYFSKLSAIDGFIFDTTTNWSNMNSEYLKNYEVVLWLNDFPQNDSERNSFERYIHDGGGWLGFHVAAYNDKYTKWRWFVDFLGGGVFYMNNWPPLPALVDVDDPHHPITAGMPSAFKAPINEWYQWLPSPRLNKDVHVLLSLNPSNFPLGKKDLINGGDVPIVWTNTKYRMLYMNMGHGDKIFTDSLQNKLFEHSILWLGQKSNFRTSN